MWVPGKVEEKADAVCGSGGHFVLVQGHTYWATFRKEVLKAIINCSYPLLAFFGKHQKEVDSGSGHANLCALHLGYDPSVAGVPP